MRKPTAKELFNVELPLISYLDESRETERRQREAGIVYDDQRVRQSIVHAREDIMNSCFNLSNIQLGCRALLEEMESLKLRLNVLILLVIVVILCVIFDKWF